MGYAARLRIVRASGACLDKSDPELVGTFVRLISGKGLGIIESVTGDTATVFDTDNPGRREILPLCVLMRAMS